MEPKKDKEKDVSLLELQRKVEFEAYKRKVTPIMEVIFPEWETNAEDDLKDK